MQRGCGEIGDVVSQSIYAGQNYRVFLCRIVHCDLLFRIVVPQFWVDGQSFQIVTESEHFWVVPFWNCNGLGHSGRNVGGWYRQGTISMWPTVQIFPDFFHFT